MGKEQGSSADIGIEDAHKIELLGLEAGGRGQWEEERGKDEDSGRIGLQLCDLEGIEVSSIDHEV